MWMFWHQPTENGVGGGAAGLFLFFRGWGGWELRATLSISVVSFILLNWWGDMLEAVRSLTHVLLIDNYPVADTNTIASLLSEPNHGIIDFEGVPSSTEGERCASLHSFHVEEDCDKPQCCVTVSARYYSVHRFALCISFVLQRPLHIERRRDGGTQTADLIGGGCLKHNTLERRSF